MMFLHRVKIFFTIFLIIFSTNSLSWNALGHRVIAEIAYMNMTTEAKNLFDKYNVAMDKVYKPQSFIETSVWLDTLAYRGINWYSTMHYIDIPYSDDKSTLPIVQDINAVWAIKNAINLLSNKYATNFDKGIATRIILHVVGDIHQPLHAITKISKEFPDGDRGGNLQLLQKNSVAKNLHSYWDRGGGLLNVKKPKITDLGNEYLKLTPCNPNAVNINPTAWANESYSLAIKIAYKDLPRSNTLNDIYQLKVKNLTRKQLALAGCRIAVIFNKLADKKTTI